MLKLRNFVLRRNISDEEITSENGVNIVGDIVGAIEPFVRISHPAVDSQMLTYITDHVLE